jgi:hypothetical protein
MLTNQADTVRTLDKWAYSQMSHIVLLTHEIAEICRRYLCTLFFITMRTLKLVVAKSVRYSLNNEVIETYRREICALFFKQ